MQMRDKLKWNLTNKSLTSVYRRTTSAQHEKDIRLRESGGPAPTRAPRGKRAETLMTGPLLTIRRTLLCSLQGGVPYTSPSCYHTVCNVAYSIKKKVCWIPTSLFRPVSVSKTWSWRQVLICVLHCPTAVAAVALLLRLDQVSTVTDQYTTRQFK